MATGAWGLRTGFFPHAGDGTFLLGQDDPGAGAAISFATRSNCSRLYRIWSRDLNFSAAQMPNFSAHSMADVKHSDMFLDMLEKYVVPGREQDVMTTAKDSMDIHRAYFGGMARAMENCA